MRAGIDERSIFHENISAMPLALVLLGSEKHRPEVELGGITIHEDLVISSCYIRLLILHILHNRVILALDVVIKMSLDTPGGCRSGAWCEKPRGAGDGVWFFLSRINALTISFSSATSDETARVEELVLTLETMALLRLPDDKLWTCSIKLRTCIDLKLFAVNFREQLSHPRNPLWDASRLTDVCRAVDLVDVYELENEWHAQTEI
ncbi:hypothetical protein Tco_1104372 [Tanacetum coccineum]